MQVLRGESKGMIKHCVKLNPLRRHRHVVHSWEQVKSHTRLASTAPCRSLYSKSSEPSVCQQCSGVAFPADQRTRGREERSRSECGLLLDCRPAGLYLLQETITLTCSRSWSFVTVCLLSVLLFPVAVCCVEWIAVLLDSSSRLRWFYVRTVYIALLFICFPSQLYLFCYTLF